MKTLTILATASLLACTASAFAAGETVEIASISCRQLMGGDDSDRAGTLAFFHGYVAARAGAKVIDVEASSERSDKVRDYCLSNPDAKVLDAFAKVGG